MTYAPPLARASRLALLFLGAASQLGAQSKASTDAAREPSPTSGTPERFAPGVISTTALEFGAGFSPSGDTLYFTRREARGRSPRILWSIRNDQGWSMPRPVAFGHPSGDQFPSVSEDGRVLYFASARPTADGTAGRANDLWYVERTEAGWSEPRHIGGSLSTPDVDSHPVQTSDGLYFHSRRPDGAGAVDAWLAPGPHGAWRQPELLPFNASGDDGELVLTPDDSAAIVYSDRAGGFGRGDLYRVERAGDGWGEPVNLGRIVNTEAWEWSPTFTPDGRFLFARLSADGGSSDLYVIDWPLEGR